ncbi:MAG TPA: hypothetical protein VFF52_28690, partial [Isosphaeraceae bacterium]|nr:hypothetical protein [Isosphaeraceae bacterium]
MFPRVQRTFSTSPVRRRSLRRRFRIEALEDRTLLTLNALDFGATITSPPVVMNGKLFFAANDSTHGTQLWESDGTASGTLQLTDANASTYGGINPTDLT